ncbi:putative nuclease HARBI1 [Triticum aestivum]|uniref:putative nuclease HARBI1 n=1 Tax=Triticum aestivum TaxID=4565 RepID=UPI001D032652|nr:putative nuclease HARBI1 [Triticum aestivum]
MIRRTKKNRKENPYKKRHVWKSSEDKILLAILKDQTLHGGKEGTGYTKKAGRDILEQFNDSRVDKLELQQLKNRHKYYRSCYAAMDRLLKLTGFGWDDDDKMIKASEETWEELIEKDKSLQEYREKVGPSWEDLQQICASSTASRVGAVSSKGKDGTCKTKSSQIDLNKDVEVHEIESDENNGSPGVFTKKSTAIEPEKKKFPGSGSKETTRGQKRTADDAITAIDPLADASLSIAEAKKKTTEQNDTYSVKSCMSVLNSMDSLDASTKLKAVKAFTDDPRNEIPAKILGDARFYPYFKNCLGAIDGTHIEAKIRLDKQTPYRNRHGYPSQNVMAAMSFDITFSYVAVGWEGSASDQAVLRWAVTSGGFVVPEGKFYLVDSGYANAPKFIAPYHGDRYHIGSFRGSNRRYNREKDMFNHLHAQLRNVVERTFGVLKARFPILSRKGGIPYPYKTQVKIVMACCIIHNFIRKVNHHDELFELYEHGEAQQHVDHGDQQVRGQAREDE